MGVMDPMQKVWVQQHRGAWNQNVLLQSQLRYLSPEALDLLDRMFDMDENNRWVRVTASLAKMQRSFHFLFLETSKL
jgi:hypothetical protein